MKEEHKNQPLKEYEKRKSQSTYGSHKENETNFVDMSASDADSKAYEEEEASNCFRDDSKYDEGDMDAFSNG